MEPLTWFFIAHKDHLYRIIRLNLFHFFADKPAPQTKFFDHNAEGYPVVDREADILKHIQPGKKNPAVDRRKMSFEITRKFKIRAFASLHI